MCLRALLRYSAASDLRLEIAGLGKDSSELFERLLVLLSKTVLLSAVNVDNGNDLRYINSTSSNTSMHDSKTHLVILDNRHNNLALARSITRNVSRKLLHIRHQLGLLSLGRRSANTAPEGNGLACYLALERTKQELLRVSRVEEVEPGPIDAGRWSWQRVVRVPEERGCVGEVAAVC